LHDIKVAAHGGHWIQLQGDGETVTVVKRAPESENYVRWYLGWIAWWVRDWIRDTWNGIPGPRWVKITVFILLGLAFASPGQIDDIIILAILRGIRYLGQRRAAKRQLSRDS
jgi:hypothetical protein